LGGTAGTVGVEVVGGEVGVALGLSDGQSTGRGSGPGQAATSSETPSAVTLTYNPQNPQACAVACV
jgi:hypothetical protein